MSSVCYESIYALLAFLVQVFLSSEKHPFSAPSMPLLLISNSSHLLLHARKPYRGFNFCFNMR